MGGEISVKIGGKCGSCTEKRPAGFALTFRFDYSIITLTINLTDKGGYAMKKRFLYLILPIITLILEILPYGAVCIFAPSPTDRVRETFSYFNPTPFGYANFSPLLTAIISCLIFVLLLIYCIKGNIRTAITARNISLAAVVMSLGQLVFGIEYFSLVGGLITLSLIAELLLLHIAVKKQAE